MSDQSKIRDSSYKLEPFFELSPDLLCIAGYDGFFKRINPAVSKVLGFTNEELFSRPINDFIHPEDQLITAKVRTELTKNTPLFNFENRYITKGGEIVWLSWTSFPDDANKVIYAIAKNITHKKKHEDDRNLFLTDLTRVNKNLKQLTYKTAHDLRSPVNNLLSAFGLFDLSKIKDKETLEFIKLLKYASENISETLNGYVNDLNHKDGLKIQVEELNIKECLIRVLVSIKSLIETSKAEISYDFSEFESILFNKEYLESIFLNLITNSIKYAFPGRHPVISITAIKSNGANQLVISDNGLGFEMAKVKDKIFGLNQKFHNYVDSKGIGLYLVYNHVTSLGGNIVAEGKENEGAKFTLTFNI
ncbi:MAG: sensor histidine kinase [Bacteroidota bacterium]|jgi:PAS domain S-box-containing protein|nr:sensor histidine kinase [Bacteroidota bacterium]